LKSFKKKPRPFGEVLEEFERKVIQAAQRLQQQLTDSADERPTATSFARDVADVPDPNEDPELAELKARRRKKLQASVAEVQRPAAKSGVTARQGKRAQRAGSGSVEQPPAAEKERSLNVGAGAALAAPPTELDVSEAANTIGAAQPTQQRSRRIFQLWNELKKFKTQGWVAGDAADKITYLLGQAQPLTTK